MSETFIPPNNCEMEAALIAAIMADNRALDRVSDIVQAEHFYEPVHGRMYTACAALIDQGEPATPLTLKSYFEGDATLESVGGSQYLFDILAVVGVASQARHYAIHIRDLWLRRCLIERAEDTIERAMNPTTEESATDILGHAEADLVELYPTQTADGAVPAPTFLQGALDRTEEAWKRFQSGRIAGVPTGLIAMDERLGGLHPGDLVLLGGRPSMGKSSLAKTIAMNAAKALVPGEETCHHVLIFSLEQSKEFFGQTMLSTETSISATDMRKGTISSADFEHMVRAKIEMDHLPIFIDDTPSVQISYIRSVARRHVRKHPLHMIVVDYLQLLETSDDDRRQNTATKIGSLTKALKMLARQIGVPVLVLSQLSRQLESRDDKRPQLSDLRDSGAIEQDADVVLFVFREEYYLERSDPVQREKEDTEAYAERRSKWLDRLEKSRNRTDVIVAKQRHGPAGIIKLLFDGATTTFMDELSTQEDAAQQQAIEGLG